MTERRRAAEPAAFARVRDICLSFEGASEKSSWGHPNFRAANRAFVTLEMHEQRPAVCFRLEAEQVRELLQQPLFFATPYGRGQWVSRFIDGRPPWRVIRLLAAQSYDLVTASRQKK